MRRGAPLLVAWGTLSMLGAVADVTACGSSAPEAASEPIVPPPVDGGVILLPDGGTVGSKGRSCTGGPGADHTCGGAPNDDQQAGTQDCCEVQAVPGGTYNRFNDPDFPAIVSPFTLDTFEVTAGRFRTWVEAADGNLQAQAPPAGGGAHPRIGGSGWRTEWNQYLPSSRAQVDLMLGPDTSNGTGFMGCQFGTDTNDFGALTWWTQSLDTAVKSKNRGNATVLAENTKDQLDRKPLNCVPWPVLFAFCVWDGGRLPTDAEFGFALAGGGEQRPFPWGTVPSNQLVHLANRPDLSLVPIYDPFKVYVSARLFDSTVGDGTNIFEDHYSFTYGGKAMAKTDNATHVAPVGRKPLGNGKWGHADLAGGMFEWMLDEGPIQPGKCIDCANVNWPQGSDKDPNAEMDQPDFQNPGGRDWFQGGARAIRGSAWDNSAGLATAQTKTEISYYTSYPLLRTYRAVGGRCARDL
jgi:formylglycine-generating enzyme required for sulfatase activity